MRRIEILEEKVKTLERKNTIVVGRYGDKNETFTVGHYGEDGGWGGD